MEHKHHLSIDQAGPGDVSEVQEIAWQTFYETFYDTNTRANLENYLHAHFNHGRIGEELGNPSSSFFVARINGQVAGYLKVNTGDAQTETMEAGGFEIQRIYVRRCWYGQKVGQALLDHALAMARQKRSAFVWLGVWEKNQRAIRFYQKNGFEPFDTHIFRIGKETQTDLLMKLQDF